MAYDRTNVLLAIFFAAVFFGMVGGSIWMYYAGVTLLKDVPGTIKIWNSTIYDSNCTKICDPEHSCCHCSFRCCKAKQSCSATTCTQFTVVSTGVLLIILNPLHILLCTGIYFCFKCDCDDFSTGIRSIIVGRRESREDFPAMRDSESGHEIVQIDDIQLSPIDEYSTPRPPDYETVVEAEPPPPDYETACKA